MKGLWIFTLSLLSFSVMASEDLTVQEKKSIQELIQKFKKNDVKAISQSIIYPLERDQPLAKIENAQEMQKRFDQVFDASLKKRIASSTLKDWERVGWRGIMFENGDIWLRSMEDAPKEPIKIRVVNYSGSVEQKLRQQALAQSKKTLHPSIQQFSEPQLLFKTATHLIRIDQLKNDEMRYVAWKGHQNQTKKPDLILKKGQLRLEGTANNEVYTFKSGPYRYEIGYDHIGGESDAPIQLNVFKNDQELLSEEGYFLD